MAQQYGAGTGISVQMAGPFGSGGTASKLVEITIPVNWKGATSPYSQTVAVDGVSVNSRIELDPNADVIEKLRMNGIALMAENDGGVVTVYAIGNKPAETYVIQAVLMEVVA